MVALRKLLQRINLDYVGFSASAVCAVHCLIVPLLLLFGAVGPFNVLHNHTVENVILLFSGIFGISSFIPSLLYTHRRIAPFALFLAGITAIVISRFPLPLLWETVLTTGGATTIAWAHYQNWRLCKSCAVHVSKK